MVVFAKCADAVAQGRRLENLSWRLWNRETFCCENVERVLTPNSATSLPQQIQHSRRSSPSDDVPQLSGSVESVADEEAVEDFHSETPAMEIVRPVIRRQDSCGSSRSRGKERHITSDNLEKMVNNIIQAKAPLTDPLPELTSSFQPPVQKPVTDTVDLQRSGSTTTESSVTSSDADSLESQHEPSTVSPPQLSASQTRAPIIVKGFSPSSVRSCRITSQAQKGPSPSAIPAPTAAPAAQFVAPKGRARFALGASSGDDSYSDRSSMNNRAQAVPQKPKKNMFQLGGSSEDNSPESPQQGHRQSAQQQSNLDYTNSSAIEDDEDEDAIYDESAIDDEDDSSEWEDSNEESGKSSVDSKLNFKRVDSSANLTSRRSLITLMLAQNDSQVQRSSRLASQSTSALPHRNRMSPHRAHSSSPNDSDDGPLMMRRTARAPPMNPINEIPRTAARPIVATASGATHSAMLSPKTTRRNMLATELTESLRRHLVWERRQRNQNPLNNAAIQRRHTSTDVANLKQYPEKPYMNNTQAVDTNSYDLNGTDGYNDNSYYTHGW